MLFQNLALILEKSKQKKIYITMVWENLDFRTTIPGDYMIIQKQQQQNNRFWKKNEKNQPF